jgi:hypothetical protein
MIANRIDMPVSFEGTVGLKSCPTVLQKRIQVRLEELCLLKEDQLIQLVAIVIWVRQC